MLPINKTYFLFTVDMLFYLTFFSILLMFVYLQKLLHCLIIYSYKRNSSFSPCPWNLRLIGPSDFKHWIFTFETTFWITICFWCAEIIVSSKPDVKNELQVTFKQKSKYWSTEMQKLGFQNYINVPEKD